VAGSGPSPFPVRTMCTHYVHLLDLETRPFPNPLSEAAGTTVIDLAGTTRRARSIDDLPDSFRETANAWGEALNEEIHFEALQAAIARRDAAAIKTIWDTLVHEWDDRTFYDFIATSKAFGKLSFRHREMFECDDNQHWIVGGSEQVPRGLWSATPSCTHWPEATSLKSLNGGATRPGIKRIRRHDEHTLQLTDQYGTTHYFPTVLATCQSWLLTTSIDTDESLFSQDHWMALDRTSYMQSSKTFVMVDRPFWKDIDPDTGEPCMSMTLTDRLTRGTYLMDYGDDQPAVICLSYTWAADALKMLPLPVERRVELSLKALKTIYPKLNIRKHIIDQALSLQPPNVHAFHAVRI